MSTSVSVGSAVVDSTVAITNRGAGLGGQGGRLVVCSFDPGEETGWAWHAASKESLLSKGTSALLREMRPDVQLVDMEDGAADLELGYEMGQFGKSSGLGEDQQVDEMMRLVRSCWVAYEVDVAAGDTFVVVTEDFILRVMQMDRSLLAPVRLNAKLERELRAAKIGLSLQSASDAKKTVTDARLRSWNVYHPGQRHARDAQRHGILFLRRWSSQFPLRKKIGTGVFFSRVA